MMRAPGMLAALALLAAAPPGPPAPVKVVTTQTTYASIAREILGDRGTVTSVGQGGEDPHFIQPRPAVVPALHDADLFVATGMGLEVWVPALLDRADNPGVREGGKGYVAAFQGIRVLEVPPDRGRASGGLHADGDPHLQGDPVNAIVVARNILAGLLRVSPANGPYFTGRERDFEGRVLRATFGDDLVRILTPATLFSLANSDGLEEFLQQTNYQGQPLAARVGGWMRRLQPYRGRSMVCYHREYAYFSRRFHIDCAGYLEDGPGIPPSSQHVDDVITLMRTRRIPVLIAADCYDRAPIVEVARRAGAAAVVVPANTGPTPGVRTYFDLMDAWADGIARAFATPTGTR